jgi:hypothetical protein
MISIYTAPNLIEAHMVLNLLEQAGVKGLIKGEHLMGLERLDSSGFVKIYVNENDFEVAQIIISDMETKQSPTEKTSSPSTKNNSFQYGLIGFIAGSILVAVYCYTPYIVTKLDNNKDGNTDEKHVYFDNRISKTEYDRNFDGKVDFIYKYNWDNVVKSSKSDEDFDGFFETSAKYLYGNVLWSKSDTTGDGFKDYHGKYKNGILETIIFFDPKTKKPIKIQKYKGQKLISAQVDTNSDGVLDQSIEYNSIEEIIKKTKITP